MPDAAAVPNPESANPVNTDSNLSSRVAILEVQVKHLQKPSRLGSIGVLLGAIATLIAIPSAFLSLKGLLFPKPHTTLEGPDLRMQYNPTSMGLTFTIGIAASNDGNKEDIFHTPEAILATANGEELHADRLVLADEKYQTQSAPLIVKPGILKMFVSPTFSYSQSDAASGATAKSLQISFPREKGDVVKTRVCFALGSKDLEQASPSALALSTSDCQKVTK